MRHIFVSYSRIDSESVHELASRLAPAGFELWLDTEGIEGGEQWRKRIVSAIDGAGALLLILSSHSIHSEEVRKEVDLAEDSRIPIVPVQIEPVFVPPAMRYQLAGLQVLDLSDRSGASVEKLARALKQKLDDLAQATDKIGGAVPNRSVRVSGYDVTVVQQVTKRQIEKEEVLQIEDSRGKPLAVRIPATAQDGSRLRLPGAGVEAKGDLYVVLKVIDSN